jgi:hypothetical protein
MSLSINNILLEIRQNLDHPTNKNNIIDNAMHINSNTKHTFSPLEPIKYP